MLCGQPNSAYLPLDHAMHAVRTRSAAADLDAVMPGGELTASAVPRDDRADGCASHHAHSREYNGIRLANDERFLRLLRSIAIASDHLQHDGQDAAVHERCAASMRGNRVVRLRDSQTPKYLPRL